jgi:hypothetical protein
MMGEVVPLSEQLMRDEDGVFRPALEVWAKRRAKEAASPREAAWVHLSYTKSIKLMLKLKCPSGALLFLLNKLVFNGHKNPVELSRLETEKYGVSTDARKRAMRTLARAGEIKVKQVGSRSPMVEVVRPWHKV